MRLSKRMLGVAGLGAIGYLVIGAPAYAATSATVTAPGGYYDQNTLTISGSGFPGNTSINILECAAPGGVPPSDPTTPGACDGNTIQNDSIITSPSGSFTYKAYTLYKLPSATLGETSSNLPKCDSSDECVLYIGTDQTNPSAPHFYSNDATGYGAGPNGGFLVQNAPQQVPETPYAVILPAAALGLLGGGYLALRRRSHGTAHTAS